MEELRGYFAVHSQGLGHAPRAVALARGLMERRPDLYLLFLAGSPALDLVVANGFDALTMPPAPDWQTTDGVLDPVWRWYRDYGRYLRIAHRFLKGEADWGYYRFLLGQRASVRARGDPPSDSNGLDPRCDPPRICPGSVVAFGRRPRELLGLPHRAKGGPRPLRGVRAELAKHPSHRTHRPRVQCIPREAPRGLRVPEAADPRDRRRHGRR